MMDGEKSPGSEQSSQCLCWGHATHLPLSHSAASQPKGQCPTGKVLPEDKTLVTAQMARSLLGINVKAERQHLFSKQETLILWRHCRDGVIPVPDLIPLSAAEAPGQALVSMPALTDTAVPTSCPHPWVLPLQPKAPGGPSEHWHSFIWMCSVHKDA